VSKAILSRGKHQFYYTYIFGTSSHVRKIEVRKREKMPQKRDELRVNVSFYLIENFLAGE
jgi:hypothetical protein